MFPSAGSGAGYLQEKHDHVVEEPLGGGGGRGGGGAVEPLGRLGLVVLAGRGVAAGLDDGGQALGQRQALARGRGGGGRRLVRLLLDRAVVQVDAHLRVDGLLVRRRAALVVVGGGGRLGAALAAAAAARAVLRELRLAAEADQVALVRLRELAVRAAGVLRPPALAARLALRARRRVLRVRALQRPAILRQ